MSGDLLHSLVKSSLSVVPGVPLSPVTSIKKYCARLFPALVVTWHFSMANPTPVADTVAVVAESLTAPSTNDTTHTESDSQRADSSVSPAASIDLASTVKTA